MLTATLWLCDRVGTLLSEPGFSSSIKGVRQLCMFVMTFVFHLFIWYFDYHP